MSDSFYRTFEENFRGSRELIRSRLQVYLPFVRPFLNMYPVGKVLDVGCGRGEWLELMGEQGFDALGVDLDDGMLQACRERSLKVERADAVEYMQGLPESNLCIVSGFHIAEHLPFEVLQRLVQEALRVLVPGGLLILETPNPENITVASCSFYIDPTHKSPIPPKLLSFLPEHYGFARFTVMRLQESAHLHSNARVGLLDVLTGVSPDYAVVAQKQGLPLLMEALTPVFDQHHGLTLDHLVQRYEQGLYKRLTAIEAALEELQAVYASTSWQITKPLRVAEAVLRPLMGRALRLALCNGEALARRSSVIKKAALWLLRLSPWLRQLTSRFSDAPINTILAQQKTISHFEELRSVRIMKALSELPADSSECAVTFLKVNDDVR
jgi:SAM-dependent methyltransferase